MTKKLFRPWSTSSNEILDYLSRWEMFVFDFFVFFVFNILFVIPRVLFLFVCLFGAFQSAFCFQYTFVIPRVLFVFNLLFAISRVPDNEELESYKQLQPKVKVGTKEQSKR